MTWMSSASLSGKRSECGEVGESSSEYAFIVENKIITYQKTYCDRSTSHASSVLMLIISIVEYIWEVCFNSKEVGRTGGGLQRIVVAHVSLITFASLLPPLGTVNLFLRLKRVWISQYKKRNESSDSKFASQICMYAYEYLTVTLSTFFCSVENFTLANDWISLGLGVLSTTITVATPLTAQSKNNNNT